MAWVLPRRIFSCFQARYGNTRPQRCPICAGSHLTDTYEKFPFFLASNLKWFFLSSPHPAALCAFSEGRCSLGGSQPCFSPNQIVGQSDHMGRAHRSHRWGHRFESCCDHHQRVSDMPSVSEIFSFAIFMHAFHLWKHPQQGRIPLPSAPSCPKEKATNKMLVAFSAALKSLRRTPVMPSARSAFTHRRSATAANRLQDIPWRVYPCASPLHTP